MTTTENQYKNMCCIIITMSAYTRSVSLHSMYTTTRVSNVLNELRRCLPYVTPCYAVSRNSPSNCLTYLNEHNVGLVCYTKDDIMRINHTALGATVIDSSSPTISSTGLCNEYIVRNVDDIVTLMKCPGPGPGRGRGRGRGPGPVPLLWIKTAISNEGVERTREMFEYIWAHKCLLNGIVFDIHNFTNGYIPPTMYNYKVATEYIFRNMVIPFEREYGIQTPAIMIDGQDHITQIRHLAELHSYALKETSLINGFTQKKPELRLILGALFDSVGGGTDDICNRRRRMFATHEYP